MKSSHCRAFWFTPTISLYPRLTAQDRYFIFFVPMIFTLLFSKSVLASVPWTNELFYYAIVAVDEKGNRGQIR